MTTPSDPAPGRPASPPPLWPGPGWLAFAVAVLGFPLGMLLRPAPPPLPHLGRLPDFEMTDQAGATVNRSALVGQVVVLDFIFTRCPDVCPRLTAQMAGLRAELPAQPWGGSPVTFVSVSVDPEHDSPAVLADYAAQYGADPATWRFVTGPRAQVEDIAEGLIQGLTLGPEGRPAEVGDITHGERFILIDEQGSMRGAFETDAEGLSAVVRGALALARDGD